MQEPIEIFTDGASSSGNKAGGWAIYCPSEDFKAFGKVPGATNNQMELKAVIMAVCWGILTHKPSLLIWSDSEYVVKGWNDYLPTWADLSRKKNPDYWQTLLDLRKEIKFELRWTRGHAGTAGNEVADQLAFKAARDLI
jgi:ribonuclease HI/DNA polymerase-3 subunit epsilon